MFELLSFGDSGWGDDLLMGAVITVQLALCSVALGFSLGLLLAISKLSGLKVLQWVAEAYTLFVRGVPEFLILLLVFFGSEQIINASLASLGFETTVAVPKFAAAVAGLSLIFAAYSCEVFRGAYLSVPPGQMEAAEAVGMTKMQGFLHIRMPQLWRFAIPGLGNLWMVMLKDTSLAAVIALDELLRVAKVAGEATTNPLLFFVAAGLIYLALTALSDILRDRAERSAQKGVVGI
jgi:His/Glu/Gln/Arg/opine family amino acid ABC transporter permease subunit